jgi:hypothetical protein
MPSLFLLFGLDKFESDTASSSPPQTLSAHLQASFEVMFFDIIESVTSAEHLGPMLDRFPLSVVADRWTATACERVAQAFGLPGEVLHSLLQGRVRFLGSGPNAGIKVDAGPDTESEWDLAAHRCGCWLVGTSGVGKDNALAALATITNYTKEATKARSGKTVQFIFVGLVENNVSCSANVFYVCQSVMHTCPAQLLFLRPES